MAFEHQFPIAYFLLCAAGLWAFCYWQVSDFLTGKRTVYERAERKSLEKPQSSPKTQKLRKARLKYWEWNIGISILLIFIIGACLRWTASTQELYALSQLYGTLYPAHDHFPSSSCSPTNGQIALYLGGVAAVTNAFPATIVAVANLPVISIDRDQHGALLLTAEIRDVNDRIVVSMSKNEFRVNPNNYFELKRPDRSSLIVVDQFGKEALNARYLNASSFRFTASFYSSGRRVDILPSGIYSGHNGSGLEGFCIDFSNRSPGAPAFFSF